MLIFNVLMRPPGRRRRRWRRVYSPCSSSIETKRNETNSRRRTHPPSASLAARRRFFDAGKNGDGIPDAEIDHDDAESAEAAATADAEAAAEAEYAQSVTAEDWKTWVAAALAKDSFTITKTSKKGNARTVDLRPQLLELSHLDQPSIDAALGGRHIPIPPTPQPGTALLRFKGEYTGAGGLSCDGMARMLSSAAGKTMTVLHTHRVGIGLTEPSPPKVDKLWLDNIVRAEAFMGLERIWDPASGVNNRGHMGPSSAGDRIDNHKAYRPAEVAETADEKKKPPPKQKSARAPGRNERWKKK